MKQGTTGFEQLVERVAREAKDRDDFVTPANELSISSDALGSQLGCRDHRNLNVLETAHGHLAGLAGIDRRYYDRMREQAPGLLDANVNHWLGRSNRPRLVRAVGDDVRAVASDRYATLDNDALLAQLGPLVDEIDGEVESCDIDDRRMIIKIVSRRLEGDVQVGDTVQAGITVTNSETRSAGLSAQMFLKRLVCSNGMTIGSGIGDGIRRRHSGPAWFGHSVDASERVDKQQWEKNVWNQFGSAVRLALKEDRFENVLATLRQSTRIGIKADPDHIAEKLGDRYGLPGSVQQIIEHHLDRDGHSNAWQVINGVTRSAADVATYDLAGSLEELGGRLSILTDRDWTELVHPN